MIVSLIAAMAENRVIGRDGALPWHLPADLARFKALTLGHPVIMGRKTFAAIGRPLPGRLNIVLSRQPAFRPAGVLVARSLAEALQLAAGAVEVFICGGGQLYREALPLAERIYLTIINREYPGDTVFPDVPGDFMETDRREEPGDPPLSWITYQRAGSGP